MNDETAREKLAGALRGGWVRGVLFVSDEAGGTRMSFDLYADALIPVVREIAAEELREAATEPPGMFGDDDADDFVKDHVRDWLQHRADALTKPPDGPVR